MRAFDFIFLLEIDVYIDQVVFQAALYQFLKYCTVPVLSFRREIKRTVRILSVSNVRWSVGRCLQQILCRRFRYVCAVGSGMYVSPVLLSQRKQSENTWVPQRRRVPRIARARHA